MGLCCALSLAPLNKEKYFTTILMNLPHLPISAYNHQDIANSSVCRWIVYIKGIIYRQSI